MLDGKKVAIMVEEGFEDSEFVESMRSMKNAGAKVVVIGSGTRDTYQGVRGTSTASVDAAAADVDVDNFDAVIVLGGNAPDRMRLHPSMVDLVKKAHDSGKVVAAICHGPQLLISADIVRGRRITSWPSISVDLKNAGAEWVDEPVVRDGNIITSRKPADLPRFHKAIIGALGGKL